MLASMIKNEFAKALVRFERGLIDMWDDVEGRLRMSFDYTSAYRLLGLEKNALGPPYRTLQEEPFLSVLGRND